jgi:serine/threonine-protein kinase
MRVGRYQLVERLGGGAVAEVWMARGDDGRKVALKRVHPHLESEPGALEMLEAEARLGRRLKHANIAQVIDSAPGYLVMEHVEGRSLLELLRKIGRAPTPGLGPFIVAQICRGLACAHRLLDEDGTPLQLVHRDVKPANVMLGHDGSVKLVDFGIAKELGNDEAPRTATGVRKGTRGYFAPEQLEGRFDARADLFAAGVVLHELLTGRPLFGDDPPKVAPPPSQLNPAVPPELDAICLGALALDPAQRPADADELAESLEEIAAALGFDREALVRTLQQIDPESEPTAATVGKGRPRPRRRRRWLLAGIAAGLLAAALWFGRSAPAPPATATATAPLAPAPVVAAPVVAAPVVAAPVVAAPVVAAPIAPAPATRAPAKTAPAHGAHRKASSPHRAKDDPLHPAEVADPFR